MKIREVFILEEAGCFSINNLLDSDSDGGFGKNALPSWPDSGETWYFERRKIFALSSRNLAGKNSSPGTLHTGYRSSTSSGQQSAA